MSDTREDVALYKIEERLKRDRKIRPCDEYIPVNRMLDICSCGWGCSEHENWDDQ